MGNQETIILSLIVKRVQSNMAFANIVTMPGSALVAPLDSIDRRARIFTRQIKLSCLKNTRSAASFNVKAFKGAYPASDVLEHAAYGITPSIAPKSDIINRNDFPQDFFFGCSTSAFQTEGPGDFGGRGPSTWDHFIREQSGEKVPAVDSYNRYKEDVQNLKKIGLTAYRFSIGWPRILPDGTLEGGINQEGIDFYNRFIDELVDNGITPVVTLSHFDLPQALQNKYKGFLSNEIVKDFKDYANVCFKNFGNRVKYWTTINEPQVFAQYGFSIGMPSDYEPKPTDPFLAAHHIILSHAAAAKLYKEEYQESQKGQIGISLVTQWFMPYRDNENADKEASKRAFEFLFGWFMEPLMCGDYPFIMKALVGKGLPEFTEEEKEMVKGSFDFIGVNYYTSRYAKDIPYDPNMVPDSSDDYQQAELLVYSNDGNLIGERAPGSEVMYVYPEGLRDALIYIKEQYGNLKIYVTENGFSEKRDDNIPVETALQDNKRIKFIMDHLDAIKEARGMGVDVKGYFMWALMDCLEMGSYYNVRFGFYYTDYLNNLARYPKKSAEWMKSFMTSNLPSTAKSLVSRRLVHH